MKKYVSLILVCLLLAAICLPAAVNADKDIAKSISLPAALLKGHTYDLQITDASLTVNGAGCDTTFVADGNQVELVYADKDGNTIATYTLPVVDTNNSADHCAYFYDPAGTVSMTENENDITLSFNTDSSVSFLSKLNPEDLAMYLLCVEGQANFEKAEIVLTDANDATVSLTFVLDLASKAVSQGKNTAQLKNLFDIVQLRYKDTTKKLMLGNDTDLLVCTKDDNGDEFKGFSGGVYLSIRFHNVTGKSVLRLNRLGNHPLGHKNSTTPDMTAPTITFTSGIVSTMYMGDQFVMPEYEVFDVLSPISESSVSVEAPDGTVYTENFTISQYGKYKLTSIAKDSYGNQSKNVKMLFVNDDIVPELTVSNMENTTYKVGDAVKIPGYTVSDNLDKCYVDVLLFLPNAEIRLLTHDASGEIVYCLTDSSLYNTGFIVDNTSFRAEQVGTYTIRYVAYDDQYNRVVYELTFQVQ